MAGAGEDGVDAVSVPALEVISVEQAVIRHVADDRLYGGTAAEFAADGLGGGLVAGAPDLELVEAVALMAFVDIDALDGDAGPGFGGLVCVAVNTRSRRRMIEVSTGLPP